MSDENPARWAPDPTGRHEYRYWEGSQWTDHVADNGVTGLDVPLPTPEGAVDDVAPATGAWAPYRRLPTWALIASDVDCEGGGGNGPAYVAGPVQVIGSDIYGLDSDHDGLGCES